MRDEVLAMTLLNNFKLCANCFTITLAVQTYRNQKGTMAKPEESFVTL